MSMGWQDIMALGLVALAIGYLARLATRAVSPRKAGLGCGSGCGSCPSGTGAGASHGCEPLVSIGPPRIATNQANGRPSP